MRIRLGKHKILRILKGYLNALFTILSDGDIPCYCVHATFLAVVGYFGNGMDEILFFFEFLN